MSTGTLTFDREGLQALDRRAVEEFGIPTLVLMENAGRAVALAVQHAVRPGSRVLIVCGPEQVGPLLRQIDRRLVFLMVGCRDEATAHACLSELDRIGA